MMFNLVLGFKNYYSNYYSTSVENLVQMLHKLRNKYLINAIKYYEHMIQCDHFYRICFQNLNCNYFKSNSSFKSSCSGQSISTLSSECSEIFIQTINDLCDLSVTSEKFPDSFKAAKLKHFIKKIL